MLLMILTGCARTGHVYLHDTGEPIEGAWIVATHIADSFPWVSHGYNSTCFESHAVKTDEKGYYHFSRFPASEWLTKVNKKIRITVFYPGYDRINYDYYYRGDTPLKYQSLTLEDELDDVYSASGGYCGLIKDKNTLLYFKALYKHAQKSVEKFNNELENNLETGEIGSLKKNYKELFKTDSDLAERFIRKARAVPRGVCFGALSPSRIDLPEESCPWPTEFD